MTETFDALVVGARCAGATLALRLAQAGWRVAVVDREPVLGDTVSTHVVFPNTLATLDDLGVLGRIDAAHEVPRVDFGWHILGHEVAGRFTPVGGHDGAACIRCLVLDGALLAAAAASGSPAGAPTASSARTSR